MTTLGKLASGPIGAAALSILIVAPAGAQTQPKQCPEGRAFNGECANPGLTQSMRLGTVVNTQPKLSYTAPPMLPSQERGLGVAPSYHEVFQLYTYPPYTIYTVPPSTLYPFAPFVSPSIRNPRP